MSNGTASVSLKTLTIIFNSIQEWFAVLLVIYNTVLFHCVIRMIIARNTYEKIYRLSAPGFRFSAVFIKCREVIFFIFDAFRTYQQMI